jgi:hypothetical protein
LHIAKALDCIGNGLHALCGNTAFGDVIFGGFSQKAQGADAN